MKRFFQKLKNNHGFTLAEVLIASGLMGVVSLAVMQTMSDTAKVKKGTSQKLEMNQLRQTMVGLFKNPNICRATLFDKSPIGIAGTSLTEIVKIKGIDDIPVNIEKPTTCPGGDTENIDACERTQYLALAAAEKRTVLKAGCTGAIAQLAPCIFAFGTEGRIFLKELKILRYEEVIDAPDGIRHNNGPNQATIQYTVVKGSGIGKTAITEEDKARAQKFSVGRELEITDSFPINVSVDGNNKIKNCDIEIGGYLENTCTQLGGTIDPADKKCKDLVVESDPLNTLADDHPYAVSSYGDTQVDGHHIITGGFLDLNDPANPDIADRLDLVEDSPTTTKGIVRADGYGSFDKNVTIKSKKIRMGPYLLNTEKTKLESLSSSTLRISRQADETIGYLNLGATTNLQGKGSMLGVEKVNPSYTLDVNGNGRIEQNLAPPPTYGGELRANKDLLTNKNLVLKDATGTATFSISSNKLVISGIEVEITDGYNDTYTGQSRSSTSDDNLIATRSWLYQMFTKRIGDDLTKNIIDAITDNTSGASALTRMKSNFRGINDDWGSSYPSPNCGSSKLFLGWNSSGNAICENRLRYANSCSNGETAYRLNTNGSIDCTAVWPKVQSYVTPKWDAVKKASETMMAQKGLLEAVSNIAENRKIGRSGDQVWYEFEMYVTSSGHTGVNRTTGASEGNKESKCVPAWEADSQGDCANKCGGGGSQPGAMDGWNSPSCTFNWVVWGRVCVCYWNKKQRTRIRYNCSASTCWEASRTNIGAAQDA